MRIRAASRRNALGLLFALGSSGRAAALALRAAFATVPLAACTTWPPPTTPMPTRRIAARCAASARCVLLPGALSRAEEFVAHGFVDDLQAAAPACDVVLADAHLGYFVEGVLLPRLREDVVQPGGAAGPKPWLVGISLGGFAALAYAMQHADDVAGVLAIAPYLGRRELLRDIMAAGGPVHWRGLPAPKGGELHETMEDDLWRWLARPDFNAGGARPPVYLGYGRDDRFADAQRLLQSLLPEGHTEVTAGGHDWGPWRRLFKQWLQRDLLAAAAGPSGRCAAKP
jgi:pimeloyl-ACP methyl ester carboxylesterase